jgi:hypothetical protein
MLVRGKRWNSIQTATFIDFLSSFSTLIQLYLDRQSFNLENIITKGTFIIV